jgi:hypothetical protein
MASIRLDDLSLEEVLSPEELERLFGAGVRNTFRPTLEGLENRELYATGVVSSAVTGGAVAAATVQSSKVTIDYGSPVTATTAAFSSVGTYTQVTVGTNADGSAVAFALSADGKTTYVNNTLVGGTWAVNGWAPLTTMSDPIVISRLAVTLGDDGQAEPFGRGADGRIYVLTDTRDDPGVYAWTAVAHDVPDGGAVSMTAYTNPATNLQSLFVISADHHFVYELNQPDPGDWSGNWKQIDAALAQPQEVQTIRVIAQADGQPLVFAVTRAQPSETVTDTVKVFAVVQDPTDLKPTGKWIDLGLGAVAPQGITSVSVVSDPATGALGLVALTTDGQVYGAWAPAAARTTSAAWTLTWSDLTGGATGLSSAKLLTMKEDGSGVMEVFAVGSNNHIYRLTGSPAQLAFGGSWEDLGAVTTTGANKKTVTVVPNGLGVALMPDGTLQVLVGGKNASGANAIWSADPYATSLTTNTSSGAGQALSLVWAAYSAPSESASGWFEVSSFKQLTVGTNANGTAVAFALGGPDGHTVYVNTTETGGVWAPNGWVKVTMMVNPPNIVQIAVTIGSDGEVEPYALDSYGTVFELTADRDAPGAYTWTATEHGVPDGGAASLAAFTNPTTQLQSLFVVSKTHGFVYQLTQPQAGDWSPGWKQIDAALAQPQEVQSIRVTAQPNGSPLVIALTKFQSFEKEKDTIAVFAVVQDPTDVKPVGKWIDLGVGNLSQQGITSLSVTRDPASGAIAVVALDADGHVYEATYAAEARPTSQSWQQTWTDLTAGQAGLPAMKALSVSHDANGSLEVLAVGSNNHVYLLQGAPPAAASQPPAQWQDLGAEMITVVKNGRKVQVAATLRAVGFGRLPDGTLQILAYGTDASGQDAVWVGTQTAPNGNFLPAPATATAWQALTM